MLASIDHCTARSVFTALVIEVTFSRENEGGRVLKTYYGAIRLSNTVFSSQWEWRSSDRRGRIRKNI
jgi:hypothetical protein